MHKPFTQIHFRAEGDIEFYALLYIPSVVKDDIFRDQNVKSSIKLYVRRVLISEKFEDLFPKHLSFIKGVVDSDDLPLNVSRETLQQHKILKTIKKKLVNKIFDKLKQFKEGTAHLDVEPNLDEMSEDEKKEHEEKQEEKKKETIEKY